MAAQTESFYFNSWMSGFFMGQTIYTPAEGGREMSIYFSDCDEQSSERKKIEKIAESLSSKASYHKGTNRIVIKISGKSLDENMEKWSPKNFSSVNFYSGLFEANFGIVILPLKQKHKETAFRQYIKLSSSPLITRKLELCNIQYNKRRESPSVQITKLLQIRRFIKEFPARFFYLHQDEMLTMRRFVLAEPEDRAQICNRFNNL